MSRSRLDVARARRLAGRLRRSLRDLRRTGLGPSAPAGPPVRPSAAGAEPAGRVERALLSRRLAQNDFFGGWQPEDEAWFARYLVTGSRPQPGVIIDWLGLKTEARHHPWLAAAARTGIAAKEVPIPDDGVHAEAIEYVALLTAVERAVGRGAPDFTAVELGASYGPWATAAATLARRAGVRKLRLIAVEASSSGAADIQAHAELNGLTADEQTEIRAVHAAVSTRDGQLYFPRVDTGHDNGAQVTATPAAADYRGVLVEYDKVAALSLGSLLADVDSVDFLHMDLQGAEQALLEDDDFVAVLADKVATLFLATQSRLIEGLALLRLPATGWDLLRERPTMYAQNTRTSDPNGWTLRDGGQLWVNSRVG